MQNKPQPPRPPSRLPTAPQTPGAKSAGHNAWATGVPAKKAEARILKRIRECETAGHTPLVGTIADEAVRLHGFDPEERDGFVKVPYALLEDRSLPPVARLVAMELVSYAFGDKTEVWPSDQRVANALGVSLPSVRRAKSKLRRCQRAWLKPTGRRQYNGPAIYSVAAIKAETEKRA